jgi:hypothetical protein
MILAAKSLLTIFCICLGFFNTPAEAKSDARCTKKSLAQKNCRLVLGSGRFQFLRENLTIHDGTWRQVVPLPLIEEGAEWESLRVFDLGGRRFYELKIWTIPDALKIQSLKWFVIELKGIDVQQQLEQVIQKRRPKEPVVNGAKTQYLADKIEKHGLSLKNNKVHWSFGYKKGEF